MKKQEVILRPEDVRSYLLDASEKEELEEKYRSEIHEWHIKVILPAYKENQRKKDGLLDLLAQKAGFAGFEKNTEKTGLRDYTAGDGRVTPEIRKRIELFSQLYDKSAMGELIKEGIRLVDKEENYRREQGQRMLRDMLAITSERMVTKDAEGKRILSRNEYLQAVQFMTDKKEYARFSHPISVQVELDGKKITLDKGLEKVIPQMWKAGYRTAACCSGLLRDHPNERWASDCNHGRFLKGDCMMQNKAGFMGYLSFFKEWKDVPQPEMEQFLEDIREAAAESGWCVQYTTLAYQPSYRLVLPNTYDGHDRQEILAEAGEMLEKMEPDLKKRDFMLWLDKRSALLPSVEKNHGGVIPWTDDMVTSRWEQLALCMERRRTQRLQKENHLKERVSDVHVHTTSDGKKMIRCKVDGVQQMAVPLKGEDAKNLEKADLQVLGTKYFNHVLMKRELNRERSYSFKR